MESRKGIGKQSIRSRYLGYRDSLTKSERLEKSKKIWDNLKKERSFQEAEILLVYMDYRSEVITTGLVEELLSEGSGKRVFAPKVEGMDIAFYEIQSMEELEAGYQGIREPKENKEKLFCEQTAKESRCFLLTPGSVFDKNLGRMGYGKGFYDRFIHKFPHIVKAGLAFECQIAGQVPVDERDEKMDMVITEKQIIR